jgi:HD superfamily phosphohydrolase
VQLATGNQCSIKPQEVAGDILPFLPIFKSIMGGVIDADKTDYLIRDNYYCGLPQTINITSLRNNLLTSASGELEIKPDAIGFMYSLFLARFSLIKQVHQEMWGVFTTAKALELLHELLQNEEYPAQKIMEMYTRWGDSKLIEYLLASEDKILRDILTTKYKLKEVARLENLDIHPAS